MDQARHRPSDNECYYLVLTCLQRFVSVLSSSDFCTEDLHGLTLSTKP